MHGAAQWASFYYMTMGGTLGLPGEHPDPGSGRRLADGGAREIIGLSVVGDAMARPLRRGTRTGPYDTSGFLAFGSGGAMLPEGMKARILAQMPNVLVSDVAGASETGAQMGTNSTAGAVSTGRFVPGPGATVVSEDLTRELAPGDDELGWLAQRGSVPLGYLGDEEKSARTFPSIDGVRYSVPGDRARFLADGEIELLGRDSVTINSGRREDLRRRGGAGHHLPPGRGRRGRGRSALRTVGLRSGRHRPTGRGRHRHRRRPPG